MTNQERAQKILDHLGSLPSEWKENLAYLKAQLDEACAEAYEDGVLNGLDVGYEKGKTERFRSAREKAYLKKRKK